MFTSPWLACVAPATAGLCRQCPAGGTNVAGSATATLADLIEEIISDAVPLAEHGLYIESVAGGLIVNGSARLDDLNELLSVQLVEEGIDTVGGLIFNRLGGLPKPGAEVKIDGLTMTVRRTSRKRVEEVFVVQPEAPPLGEEEEP